MDNELEIICPKCNGHVEWEDTVDTDIRFSEYICECYGTCEKCGATVEYQMIFTLENPRINIVDSYKFND